MAEALYDDVSLEWLMIDSTVIWAQQRAVSEKWGQEPATHWNSHDSVVPGQFLLKDSVSLRLFADDWQRVATAHSRPK